MANTIEKEETDVILERIAAQIIDNAITTTVFIGFMLFAFLVGVTSQGSSVNMKTIYGGAILIGLLFTLGFTALYSILFEYQWKGQTIGKKALGIRAVKENGDTIGAKEAIIRNIPVILFINTLLVILGYFIALISIGSTEKRQRLFDKLAKTVVIDQKTEE